MEESLKAVFTRAVQYPQLEIDEGWVISGKHVEEMTQQMTITVGKMHNETKEETFLSSSFIFWSIPFNFWNPLGVPKVEDKGRGCLCVYGLECVFSCLLKGITG